MLQTMKQMQRNKSQRMQACDGFSDCDEKECEEGKREKRLGSLKYGKIPMRKEEVGDGLEIAPSHNGR